MKEELKTIEMDSVEAYNRMYGFETLHPLITVVDLKQAKQMPNHFRMRYGLYALFLKNSKSCSILYGRRPYDYQEGTVVSFAPGQSVTVDVAESDVSPDVLGLLFHPDLIRGFALAKEMYNFSFFSYASNEALHLSERERGIFVDCLDKIRQELEHAIDRRSRQLLVMNIELLLNYCMRFYDRQFITRENVNNEILTQFEQLLNSYFEGDNAAMNGLPSVKYFADKVCLSPNYFGDLIKRETGKMAQEYIQEKIVGMAKDRLIGSNETVSIIADHLGFQYPQHFIRLFKRNTGMTPTEFRKSVC